MRNCFAQVSNGLTPNNSSLGALKPHYHSALAQLSEEERLLLSVMLPLHSFQLPCMLPGWRADRKACICQQLSMCPGKLIFGTEAAGCAPQCHGIHWAVRGIKAFHSTFTICGKWDSSLSLPRNKLLQTPSFRTWSCPRGKKNYALLPSGAEML